MSSVRPEFGPTLPEIVGPRLRALPARTRYALIAATALVVIAVAALVLRSGGDTTNVVIRKPVTFNLVYGKGLERVAPHGDEVLRLRSLGADDQLFTVRPLKLGSYSGDSSAALLSLSSPLIAAMQRDDPGFLVRSEGRARVNLLPGYQIAFQTRRDGRLFYGKRFLLVSDDAHPTEGLDVLVLSPRSPAIPKVDAVGNNGLLKSPLRSLRFGTDRP
jgi:hypothetical protein